MASVADGLSASVKLIEEKIRLANQSFFDSNYALVLVRSHVSVYINYTTENHHHYEFLTDPNSHKPSLHVLIGWC